MSNVQSYETDDVAEALAKQTVAALQKSMDEYSSVTWVLAGGSTPLAAYKVIADKYQETVDWSKVTIIMGDERIGPLDGPDNNWRAVHEIIGSLPTVKLRPRSDLPAEEATFDYEQQLAALPLGDSGVPRLDVVWLGVGQDGHTLSLFPQHESMLPSGGLVTAVHDSPKPPADRISLTLRALQGALNVFVIATSADKQPAVNEALHRGHSPIAVATNIVETHGGTVTWFVDKAAAPTD